MWNFKFKVLEKKECMIVLFMKCKNFEKRGIYELGFLGCICFINIIFVFFLCMMIVKM